MPPGRVQGRRHLFEETVGHEHHVVRQLALAQRGPAAQVDEHRDHRAGVDEDQQHGQQGRPLFVSEFRLHNVSDELDRFVALKILPESFASDRFSHSYWGEPGPQPSGERCA